jgi:hypothetical protein
MITLQLDRFLECDHGTFGTIGSLYTCEEENQGNRRNVSAIPAGTYTCRRTIYHRYGYETFEVCDVPNRSRILFHSGNTEEDTEGCILVGLKLDVLPVVDEDTGARTRKLAVLQSRAAFAQFMSRLEGEDEFTLEVKAP